MRFINDIFLNIWPFSLSLYRDPLDLLYNPSCMMAAIPMSVQEATVTSSMASIINITKLHV